MLGPEELPGKAVVGTLGVAPGAPCYSMWYRPGRPPGPGTGPSPGIPVAPARSTGPFQESGPGVLAPRIPDNFLWRWSVPGVGTGGFSSRDSRDSGGTRPSLGTKG